MMRCLFGRLLVAIADLLPRPWMSSVRYLQEWPQVRPGKSGVAAARRAARKARNRRRQRHGRA
ncbi:hypothetical protein [Pseudomonas anguilliseptica]|jgi:hypothetical protein|uniref:Uncharacterized protein n=1 Tax=Pseudomonas anguilliseptica TaxID=53406 RepID=A0A1H5DM62_PSEAG|nr:hypothetical protein [Pseudomonas anguilliseptica]SED79926.1 hypothetical protein SAMN05421553_3361 [Pseudomonas anguilliseptica]